MLFTRSIEDVPPRKARIALYGVAVLVGVLIANLLAATIWMWGRLQDPVIAVTLVVLWCFAVAALVLLWRGGRRLLERVKRGTQRRSRQYT